MNRLRPTTPYPPSNRPRRRWAACVLTALLLCLLAASPGLSRSHRIERFTADRGIVQRTLTYGMQDRTGFLWFCTEDGVLRYDGHRFMELRFEAGNPDSLSSNETYHILEDRDGFFWIATQGGGLDRYDPRTGDFAHFRNDPEDPTSLSDNAVRVTLQDRDGFLWVGTNSGLNRLDPETGRFTRFHHDPADPGSLAHDTVWRLHEDRAGRIWIATYGGGLDRWDPETERFIHHRHDPTDPTTIAHDTVGGICEDNRGRLWVGGLGGLNRLDPDTGRFTRFVHDPNNPDSLPHNLIWDLNFDSDGNLWLASYGGGLVKFDPDAGRPIAHYAHNPADPHSLSDPQLWFVFEDRGEVMWIGTQAGGLNKLVRRTESFVTYSHDPLDADSLGYDSVGAVDEGEKGVLWIGLDGGGLDRFDRRTGTFTHFHHDPADPDSLASDIVGAVLADDEGAVWVGTYTKGLDRFDPSEGVFTHHTHDPEDSGSLSDNRIMTIFEDRWSRLWVGTNRGLNRYDRRDGTFRKFLHDPDDPDSISHDFIKTLAEDDLGYLWVGTAGGLNRFDPVSETFQRHRHDPREPGSLSHDTVYAVAQTPDRTLWVGTNGGLDRLPPYSLTFKHLTEKDGLASNAVRGILSDADGNLWIATKRGLSKYEVDAGRFLNFTARDGLQGNEFEEEAFTHTRAGELVFGGRGGLTLFRPGDVVRNPHAPPVVLTGATVLNQGANARIVQSGLDRLRLGYRDQTVAFEYAALDFSAPSRNRYRYKLEGFDREWIEAGNRNRAAYTNLNGGDYVFRVQGANNHGVWNTDGAALPVSVAHPPWRQWWSYLLYGLGLGVLILGLIEIRAYAQKRALVAVREVNAELKKEIDERKKAEAALRAGEQRYRSLFNEAPVMYVITEGLETPTIRDVNDMFEKTLGYSRQEVMGAPLAAYYTADSARGMLNSGAYQRALKGRFDSEERSFVARDGRRVHTLLHSLPETDDAGAVIGTRAMFLDITARKTSEEKARQLEAALRQAQKMEAIGTMAGGIAHDFNNLLSAVIGYSELGMTRLDADHEVHDYLSQILKAGNRAKELVNQILTFSRQAEIELKPIRIAPLVKEALKLLRSSLPATIVIRRDIGAEDICILADATQIHQILMNLCTNAAHAMEEAGGTLRVGLSAVDVGQNPAADPPGLSPGRYLKLTVTDTGCGMGPDTLEQIFDPYFTTKETGRGMGMGLSMVHGIVKSYRGEITVASRPGQGARFEVFLPAIDEPPADPVPIDPALPTGSESILLVDDEPDIAAVEKLRLEHLGYRVHMETDSRAALRLFRENPERFDLVLTDMTMPGMTGDVLAEKIRELRPDLPVILCTGYNRKLSRRRLEEAGIRTLLMKPVVVAELAATLREVLEKPAA